MPVAAPPASQLHHVVHSPVPEPASTLQAVQVPEFEASGAYIPHICAAVSLPAAARLQVPVRSARHVDDIQRQLAISKKSIEYWSRSAYLDPIVHVVPKPQAWRGPREDAGPAVQSLLLHAFSACSLTAVIQEDIWLVQHKVCR